jgi:hypothetical protein
MKLSLIFFLKRIKLHHSTWLIIILLLFSVGCSPEKNKLYSVSDTLWNEALGNHRAILQIDRPDEAVALDLYWRRHDKSPQDRRFLIIEAATGDTVANISRLEINNEHCKLIFGPVKKAGKYYFYYLPYLPQKQYGFYSQGYYPKENAPDSLWVAKDDRVSKFEALPRAKLLGFEARTAFDSFYPMEVIALKTEKDSLSKIHPEYFLIFPEDRSLPIRMLDDIPQKWVESGPLDQFNGEALKNEYYVFQLGIFAARKELKNLKIEFSALKNADHEIPAGKITCFNTGGIGPLGDPFVKRVDVAKGHVQPLWIGLDIPENITAGNYTGTATVWAANAEKQIVQVHLKIKSEVLTDRGDSEPWRHSRLRWLNSTLGIDDEPTNPYEAIKTLSSNRYDLTGKKVVVSNSEMPDTLNINGTEILSRPLSFVVETSAGKEQFTDNQNPQLLKNDPGLVRSAWKNASKNMELSGVRTIESDGYIHYRVNLKALKDVKVKDIRLEIPFETSVAKYMMGMGLPGTTVPNDLSAKWEGPHDSFWIGNVHAGLWCELRGTSYSGPLLNLYHPKYPDSWYNNNLGGFRIEHRQSEVRAIVYSGRRAFKKGEELTYEWAMLLTPVKKINYESQFTDRYYHNGSHPMPSDEDLKTGVKIVNLHHANNYNPHINYPFIAVDSMKWFVNQLHNKGVKVKIYYTVRELTDYTTELWALRSLGNEILGGGNGGGYPWLREHLVDHYTPQWYQWFPDKSADASILSAPGDSRWYNYYIEGLRWLVRNVGIDGLYLDDVSYDRRTVKRIRKVLDREKPGCLIDLHSNTGFSKGPATQYTEYFPYIDKLWFGESFQYDQMSPANWLVEVSGIPFGLMGDMLQGGGNRWLGMVFGMTVRYPWVTEGVNCDPRPVWKIWDEFGIAQSKMAGFWENEPVVTTNNPLVKATAYVRDGKTLIALGNWSDKPEKVRLSIQWRKIGLSPATAKLKAPGIKDFQPAREFGVSEDIPVESKKGWLILIEQ